MLRPDKIEAPKQLLAEGFSGKRFLEEFLRNEGIAHVQAQNFGSVKELPSFLRAFVDMPTFFANVVALAVVRDAEDKPAVHARNSVEGALSAAFATPRRRGLTPPRTDIFILPDDNSPGMLETLCLKALEQDPAMKCVESYIECLRGNGRDPRNPDKSRVQAFLASRDKPGLLLGEAADKGYWD